MMGQQKRDGDGVASLLSIVCLQALCGAAVVAGLNTLPSRAGFNLITHPVNTLQIALVLTFTVVLVAYASMTALTSNTRPVWQGLGCGLLGLPVGVVVAVLVAFAFGAPTSLQYASRTLHWACLMSVLVAVPAAIVLGNSWSDWQRIFAFTRPRGGVELAICIPAHGAALGAWVGAWPMPLDWERPWQEWPVSCTYGAAGGYLLGLAASMLILLVDHGRIRSKQD